MELYHINFAEDIPVYRQLVDVIRANIKNGSLENGTRLPTVRELAKELAVAQGTVKRAYDELGKEGLVDKAQGRGTFVSYRPVDPDSRKERAMAAIDAMLDELEAMNFSITETKIYLDLKLRDRESQQENLKIGVIECNPEVLEQVGGQLRQIHGIDIYNHLLGEVLDYPYQLAEEMDLIITTAMHAEAVEQALGSAKNLAKIAIRLRPHSISQIIKIPEDSHVGILCGSLRYGELLRGACQTYTEHIRLEEPCLLNDSLDCRAFLRDKDAVLLPENYEKFCSAKVRQQLQEFGKQKSLICCSYQIDEGSFMYVEEKIQRRRSRRHI